MRKDKYSFTFHWSEEDEAFVALCPSFPGLSAFGDTPQEALEEAETALELFVEEYQAEGKPLPEPQSLQGYSGQMSLRMPASLHAQLAARADVEGVSMNQLAGAYIAQGLGEDRAESEMTRELRELTQVFQGAQHVAQRMTTVLKATQSGVVDYDGGGASHAQGEVQDPMLRDIYASHSQGVTE